MKYSKKSRTRKGSSKYLKNKRAKAKASPALRKKVLAITAGQQEHKRTAPAINEAFHSADTANGYMENGGCFPNYLISRGTVVGRGYNRTSTSIAGGIADSTPYQVKQLVCIDPSLMGSIFPVQGVDIQHRIGDSISIKRIDCNIQVDWYPNFYSNVPSFSNDFNLSCPPWVVITRWEPVHKNLNFSDACTAALTYDNVNLQNWHYGMPFDWARTYQIRPAKRKILKFAYYTVGGSITSAGGIGDLPAIMPGQHTHRVNMGKHYGSKGLKTTFAVNNQSPDVIPFYITIFVMHPSAFRVTVCLRTTFTDA